MKSLVLNIDYSPLCVISAKRAFSLYLTNPHIKVLEYHKFKLRSENGLFEVPSVMVYMKYIKIPPKKRASKKYILTRDNWECGYCSNKLCVRTVSVDHVVPISKGGKSTWENLVACCKSCNTKKRNRLPEEAGMILNKKLKQPNNFLNMYGNEEWTEYLTRN